MLSPGKHHLKVPRNRVQNIKFRMHLLRRCQESVPARRALLHACREDCLFFINVFCFIFEPRAMKTYTWTTWAFQDDYITAVLAAIEGQYDANTTKSRDMGATWMLCAVVCWLWLFKKNGTYLMVSRNANLVDSENPDSLFWKIDFLLKHLPGWMKPAKPARRDMHFGNPEMNSTINGVATTSGAGIGGRCTAMVVDEFSRIPTTEAVNILQGTADTTRCRLFNYTFWGPLNHPSYDLADRPDVKQLKMHWTLHPEKAAGLYHFDNELKRPVVDDKAYDFPANYVFVLDGKKRSPWYDGEESRRNDPMGMALDVDMDRRGYGGQFFNKNTIYSLIEQHARPPIWEGELDYDRDYGEPIGLVAREGGSIKLWITPNIDGEPPPGEYGGGADLGQGAGKNPSAFSLGNAETGEKVLEYVDCFTPPAEFATKTVALCRLFKNRWGIGAKLCGELGGPGNTFSDRCCELGYGNRMWRRTDEKKSDYASKAADVKPGFAPNPQTTPVLLEQYRRALYEGHLVNRSKDALLETLEFGFIADGKIKHKSEKSSDPSATGENHGDVVVADALMWKMMKDLGAGKPEAKKEELNIESMKTVAYRRKLNERMAGDGSRLDLLMRPRQGW